MSWYKIVNNTQQALDSNLSNYFNQQLQQHKYSFNILLNGIEYIVDLSNKTMTNTTNLLDTVLIGQYPQQLQSSSSCGNLANSIGHSNRDSVRISLSDVQQLYNSHSK